MGAPEFDAARLRVERAGQHSAEMASIWNSFLEPHPFEFHLQRVSPREYEIQVTLEEPMPPELSVLFGEWLYNLRSALDYVIWAAAVHTSRQNPPPAEAALQYPIYESQTAWDRNLYRLKPLAEHHREMLATMQPFNSDPDGNYLGWLNRLARVDRHRTLAISTARVAQAEPVIAAPDDTDPSFRWGERTLRDGICRLARIDFERDVEPGEIEFNPRVGIDPEVLEWAASPFWSETRFSDRLLMIQLFVSVEITLYEFDATGESEHADRLTQSFKDSVLARRATTIHKPIQRQGEAEPSWSAPVSGQKSSRARLLGEDFPSHGGHSSR